ncbi:MAG: hypothetical protein AAF360_10295, partial [Pseudomonadota bacterium]
ATQNIAEQIARIQDLSGQAAQAIGSARDMVEEIAPLSTHIANDVTHQESMARNVSTSVNEIAEQISDLTASLDGLRQETASSKQAAGDLHTVTQRATTQIAATENAAESYLAEVRALQG